MSTVTAIGAAQIAPDAPSAPAETAPPVAPTAPAAPVASTARAASTDKFTGESNEDYIQWRVRTEASMRAQGVWDAVISPEDETPEMRAAASAVLLAALESNPSEVVKSAAGNPREMFRLLDDKYIPKRNKAKYAERFAAAPEHFCNFKEMLSSVPMDSDDEADSDFKIQEIEEEESESENESDDTSDDDTEEREPDDRYDSEDDEDYKIDPAKLVEDEEDEDEDMEVAEEEVKKK